jgi:choloylglycine hydrolase
MKSSKMLLFHLLIILVFLIPTVSNSCTTFYININGEIIFGKNYDWMTGNGMLVINKRNVSKTSLSDSKTIDWVSKYGSVTFNQFGREFPSGGINEEGLAIEVLWLKETKYPEPDSRPVLEVLQWIQYQLDNSQSVSEVIESNSVVSVNSDAATVHYLVADANGNAVSIEFLNGKMVYHTGDRMPITVLANNTYEESLSYYESVETPDEVLSLKSLNSLDRFATACSMVQAYERYPKESVVDYGFSILQEVKSSEYTQWSIIYDIKNRVIYFKTLSNEKIRDVELSSINFDCDTPVKVVGLDENLEGNINSYFIDYTTEYNRNLIRTSYDAVEFLRNIQDEYVNDVAEYPESMECENEQSILKNDVGSSSSYANIIFFVFLGLAIISICFFVYSRVFIKRR